MNRFLYDLLRTLQNRGVLIMMALTSLLCLALLLIGLPHLAANGATSDTVNAFAVNGIGAIYGFFIPVTGILAAYETYAKDRASGILDAVLCRPVSRGELVSSRFLAVVLSSAVSLGVALGLMDAVVNIETTFFINPGDIATLYVGLLVEACAFGGIVFLLAHVFRSAGIVQGTSTIIFVMFSIIWYVIIAVIIISTGLDTTSAIRTIVVGDYFNPAQFTAILLAYNTHSFFFFLPISNPAGDGLYLAALVASGAFWSAVPFLITYYLACKRD
jgi:ABC-2 type transport system permease protein